MAIKADTGFSLADELFNADTVGQLSTQLASVHDDFDRKRFDRAVLKRFPSLELKQRIHWIVTVLESHLPANTAEATQYLQDALPPPLDPSLADDDFGHFIWVVPGEYVAKHGCTEKDLQASLAFLREATKRFSSEGAIRPFLSQFPEPTLRMLHECAVDSNYHVRRLASEGIRPFLPWASRVVLPVQDIIAVLDRLHADSTRYVTRSVCNTLNDISRIDANAVVSTLERWQHGNAQSGDEMAWMCRHALRTLLKQNHPAALELMGYSRTPKFRLSAIETSGQVLLGDAFRWRCTFTATASQHFRIALHIHYLKANGSHAVKVFNIKDLAMDNGEVLKIDKKLPFRPMTTRALYPGEHFAELVVNGVTRGKRPFALVEPA